MNKPWMNAALPVEARIDALLEVMTPAEKIGQTQQVRNINPSHADALRAGSIGSALFASGAWAGNERDGGVRLQALHAMQRVAVEESRLGIPLLYARDVIHGHRTVFPIPLGQAATWSPDLVRAGARIAATEAAAEGLHWTFTPMLDIVRDPRWGRVAESFGEDPHLCGELARAAVRGYQGDDLAHPESIAACAKHFAAYGGAEGGRDYNTVDIGPRSLRDTYLPPFRAAVRAGVATVMASFNEIDGMPVTAHRELLRQTLKENWGFDGLVVSDWNAVAELIAHGVASDRRAAGKLALDAGVDIDMVSNIFLEELAGLVESGDVSASALDDAVRRILRVKFRLGLFEQPMRGHADPDTVFLQAPFRQAARQAAAESLVLLENRDGLLPLRADTKRILLTGPLASADQALFGTWTLDGLAGDVVTLEKALREGLGKDVDLRVKPFVDEALLHARSCDVALVCVGEHPSRGGEANSVVSLELPAGQTEILEALHRIGLPIVAIVIAGRPLDLSRVRSYADAILFAFHPGVEGGHAIADVLLGHHDACGRLPMSFPRHGGQVPLYYNHKSTGRPLPPNQHVHARYADSSDAPLYPFGYGLGYTRFAYGTPRLSAEEIPTDGELRIDIDITNHGDRPGIETVQVYVRDLCASVTRPVRELKSFARVALVPGETRTLAFAIQAADLAFSGPDLRARVEPGEHHLWVAAHALAGEPVAFRLTGPVVYPDPGA